MPGIIYNDQLHQYMNTNNTLIEYDPYKDLPKKLDWQQWNVEILALAIRGQLGQDFNKEGIQCTFVIDSGFNHKTIIAEKDCEKAINITVYKHPNKYFYLY